MTDGGKGKKATRGQPEGVTSGRDGGRLETGFFFVFKTSVAEFYGGGESRYLEEIS